jgi:hypothetical protein
MLNEMSLVFNDIIANFIKYLHLYIEANSSKSFEDSILAFTTVTYVASQGDRC